MATATDPNTLSTEELAVKAQKYLDMAVKPGAGDSGVRIATTAFDKYAAVLVTRVSGK